MSLIIELSPEIEAWLAQRAVADRATLEQVAQKLLADLAHKEKAMPIASSPVAKTKEERLKAYEKALTQFHTLNLQPLPAEAYERDSFYDDERHRS